MSNIAFTVPGIPIPKGSWKSFGPGRFVPDNPESKPWAAMVEHFARQAMRGREKLTGAVRVEAVFTFPRIKSHYGAKGLKPSAPRWHTVKPDADKLQRLVGDVLSGVVMRDDAQIAEWSVRKLYAVEGGDGPGLWISAGPL